MISISAFGCGNGSHCAFRRFEDEPPAQLGVSRIFAATACRMGTHSGLSHPLPPGDSRNGTERFLSLRMPRIVPSNRRLRFDGPLFRFGDPRSSLTHEIIFLMPPPPGECYTATSDRGPA
jgi:hypothetical protein